MGRGERLDDIRGGFTAIIKEASMETGIEPAQPVPTIYGLVFHIESADDAEHASDERPGPKEAAKCLSH